MKGIFNSIDKKIHFSMTTNTSLEDIYVCCKDDISILASFLSRILAIMDLVTKLGLNKKKSCLTLIKNRFVIGLDREDQC